MSDGTKNLMVARGEKSVWDKPSLRASLSSYDRERWIGCVVGSAVGIYGVRRGGAAGGLMTTLGALLAIRAMTGKHDFGMARSWIERAVRSGGWRKDVVTDASEDSFPASDSPAWTSTAGARMRPQ